MEFKHETVLLKEALSFLNIKKDGIYVDCTLGGAGHSLAILKRLGKNGRLIALDQDKMALESAEKKLCNFLEKVSLVKENFRNIKKVVTSLGYSFLDGVIFDLGVSSLQLDLASRGFSYKKDAFLDMRMDLASSLTAYDIVNKFSFEQLKDILKRYGQERFARSIAKHICFERKKKEIKTTLQLAEIVNKAIPAKFKRLKNPARKTFQALRIKVNDELEALEVALRDAIDLLNKKGRIVVISFHSLEDKICKSIFQEKSKGCSCFTHICVCGKKPILKLLTKKPILPSEEEILKNNRSRSAKLRAAEKI